MKEYKKVEIKAKNAPTGSYAAGCPADSWGGDVYCKQCERTM